MSNISFIDGESGSRKYLKAAGAGTIEDPLVLDVSPSADVPVVGPQSTVSLTIANNAALSEAFDMTDYIGGMVIVPGAWTAANIGFKVCDTLGGTYVIAKDKVGVPIQITTVATGASGAYAIPTEIFCAAFVKLWSKHATPATETDINQGAARAMKVMLK